MTEAEPKSPGYELRAARERLGLSVQDVAIATKINAKVLKALEEGDRDVLPAKSFARGFIRSYAAYLKIDAEPILAAYNDLRADSGRELHEPDAAPIGDAKAQAPTVPSKPAKSLRSSYGEPSIASRVAIFAVIFVLVGLIIFVKKLKDKYEREKITPATVPVVTAPTQQNVPPSLGATTLQHGPALQPETKPDTSNALKPDTAKNEKTPVKPVGNEKPQQAANTAESAKQAAEKTKLVEKPHAEQEIIVEALDNVDITIRVGHEPPQTVHLVPQAVHTIKANDSVEVDVADGGMVNIIRNGRDRGVPGQLGKPIKLKYP